jgi:hypothetical protein
MTVVLMRRVWEGTEIHTGRRPVTMGTETGMMHLHPKEHPGASNHQSGKTAEGFSPSTSGVNTACQCLDFSLLVFRTVKK